jgi:hypothetical protein
MYTKIRTRKPKIFYKSLRNNKTFRKPIWGYADKENNTIVLETRMGQLTWLYTFIHEHLHCFFPGAGEREVEKISLILAFGIWDRKFRRNK